MKYALVTGASSGIGLAFCKVLAQKAYNLVMVSNQEKELKERAEEISSEYSVTAVPVTMDLADVGAPARLYDFCREQGFEVEFLVNNAGVYHDRDFLDDSAQFNSMILILHVHTPAMLEYFFGKDMLSRHRGYIINISSVTSDFGIQRQATYSSTKGFLRLFSRSTHVELHEKGVNVCCVRPGAVATTLYSLSPSAIRTGLALGYIITPEKLASKAVRAAMRGCSQLTPGLSTKLLQFLVALIPTCLLRLIRRMKLF